MKNFFLCFFSLVLVIETKALPDPKSLLVAKASPVVAVIDTGVDIEHELLKHDIWTNPGEIPGNNLDDDKNGFVDDIHGWDFSQNTNQLIDHIGHGTHIAGIISQNTSKVQLMVLKFINSPSHGNGSIEATVKAINYAIRMKAQIINYSAGGLSPNEEERAAIYRALEQNVLFVAAAGNHGQDNDLIGYFPASYNLPNIVSVAALQSNRRLLDSSNFGPKTVHLAAPGYNIYSSLPNNRFGWMSGTSQATAFVTAMASETLLKAKNKLSATALKETVIRPAR